MACALPNAELFLLEGSTRRAAWLLEAVAILGLSERVQVVDRRAEVAAHEAALRGAFAVVTARAFSSPAVTAECAVGFLQSSGWLIVSEPPEPAEDRWPAEALAGLGLSPAQHTEEAGFSFVLMRREGEIAPRYPRRTGIPAKRPLF